MKVFVDGKFLDEKKAVVSVFDHGLLYGDGVFESHRARIAEWSANSLTSSAQHNVVSYLSNLCGVYNL